MSMDKVPLDSNGNPFTKPVFWLDSREYCKICSEINQVYDVQYYNKRIAAHVSFGIDGRAYVYWFENHGFEEYNIFMRVLDCH